MDHFSLEGQWWLPAEPEYQVPGTCTFDGDGLRLVLYKPLRNFELPDDGVFEGDFPEWKVEPVVHGRTRDAKRITLFDVGGVNLVGPFDVVKEVYHPELALVGCHTTSDSFIEAWCEFDYLDAWANPPAVTIGSLRQDSVQVRVKSVDLGQAVVNGTSLRLVSGVAGTGRPEEVHLKRWTSFCHCAERAIVREILHRQLRTSAAGPFDALPWAFRPSHLAASYPGGPP